MMLRNTPALYGSVSKFFHWMLALLIIGMLFLGYLMEGKTLSNLHKLTGLLILTLVACRLLWMLANPRPRLPREVSPFEKFTAHFVQALLYVCMFGMPLSGWAKSTTAGHAPHLEGLTFPLPGMPLDSSLSKTFGWIHGTLALILIALIALHILGALKHHFFDKNTVLTNMLPKFKGEK